MMSAAEWEYGGARRPDLARLYDAIYRNQDALLAKFGAVPVRRLAPTPQRPHTTEPITVGTLVTLWRRWGAMRGKCPRCGGDALGTGYNGFLANAHLFGVCRDQVGHPCGAALRRWHGGGLAAVVTAVRTHLAGTDFPIGAGWTFEYDREAPYAQVIAALAEVGERTLEVGANP